MKEQADFAWRVKKLKKGHGFTLVELLVIISIVGLVSSVALANLQEARDRARTSAGIQQEASIRSAIGDTSLANWGFDEGSGSTARDGSGVNDGEITGATYVSPGSNGTGFALNFDGEDDYVTGTGIPSNSNGPVTVTAWVYPEANNDIRPIFTNGYSGNLNYSLVIKSGKFTVGGTPEGGGSVPPEFWSVEAMNNLLQYNVALASGGTTIETTPGSLSAQNHEWTFVAATFLNDPDEVKIYVNGVLAGTATNYPIGVYPTDRWTIGALSLNEQGTAFDTNSFFAGLIDNPAVYSGSPFTGLDIYGLYAKELAAHKIAEN